MNENVPIPSASSPEMRSVPPLPTSTGSIRAGKKRNPLLLVGILAAAGVIATVAFGLQSGSGGAADGLGAERTDIRPLTVNTVRAQYEESYILTRRYVGRAEAARSGDLGFEVGGRVVKVTVDEGAEVEAGQVLATLNPQLLNAQRSELEARLAAEEANLQELKNGPRDQDLAEAESLVEAFEARLELAKRSNERVESLAASNVESRQRADEASLRVAEVRAELEAARQRLSELREGTRPERIARQVGLVANLRAQIDSVDVRLEKTELRAPYRGIVSDRMADEGAVLSVGQPILKLLEIDDIEVRVGISPRIAATLEVGQNVTLEKPRGEQISALIQSIDPDRSAQTRTITIILQPMVEAGALRPGDLVYALFDEAYEEGSIRLPVSALTESIRGLWACYVVEQSDKQNILDRRDVEVIALQGDHVFVRGTLQPGELVVADGAHRVISGQPVLIAPKTPVNNSGADSGNN